VAENGTVEQATLQRARAGDEQAFRELTDPYRRELQVHCYRMLGSLTDAEDMLQETLLAAWRGLAGFTERASLRSWLYRIATNQCLNARRAARRRIPAEPVPPFQPPEPTRGGEITWLQPYPDALLEGTCDPEARYQATEAIELAFIAGLQRLPPRQAATLGLFVLAMAGPRIRAITRFHRDGLYPRFGLPSSLPEPAAQDT
jgi:RNA polymerase sigma factor (sigma-70 family)